MQIILFSLVTILLYVFSTSSVHSRPVLKADISKKITQYLHEIADPVKGIGAREAGSAKEKETIAYVEKNFKAMGLSVSVQPFPLAKNKLTSANVIANLNNNKTNTLVLAAHLDSTGAEHGSHGATDNASGLAAMLTVAGELSETKDLPYNIRFIAFGAEEVGLLGAKHYVKTLLKEMGTADNILAMINLDTIAGGDFLYVHSAHTTPYKCGDISATYNSDTHVRDALFTLSNKLINKEQQYIIHPAYEGYPEGVPGGWSDHAPVACAGVPLAYIESTNFTINGKDGYDGYSQSDHSTLWDCFDNTTDTACDREEEHQWGHIWHTKADQLAIMDKLFSQRMTLQLTASVEVLIDFLSNYKLDANKKVAKKQ